MANQNPGIKVPSTRVCHPEVRRAVQDIIRRLGTSSTPTFELANLTTIELGHASDTTLSRASSGDVNIEGNIIYRAGGTDVPVTDGGTGVSTLTDGGVLLGSGTNAITAMAALADGEFIVGNGTTDPVAESGNTARTSLGLGEGDSPILAGLTIVNPITEFSTDGTMADNSDSAVPTEAAVVSYIGTSLAVYQAQGDVLDDLNTLGAVASDGQFIVGTGAGVFAYESSDTARISLGVGITDSPTFAGLTLTGKFDIGSQAVPIDVTNVRQYGIESHYSGNDYDVTGTRSRAQLVTTDTTAAAIGGLFQAANNDGIDAGVLNGLVAEAIGKSTSNASTITTMRGALVGTEWGALDTVTHLKTLHVRGHSLNSAGAGSFGTGYGIYIENEAVGGNGQAYDAGIYFKDTNLSGGNSAFTYGIDFTGGTYGTADVKLSSGGNVDVNAGTIGSSSGNLIIKPSSTYGIRLQPTTDSTTFLQVLDADGGTAVLNVDTTNEQVTIGKTSVTYPFLINSTDASDQIMIFHENSNAYIRWNDGKLILQSDEGTNANTQVLINPKGIGTSSLYVYGQGGTYFRLQSQNNAGEFFLGGASANTMNFQYDGLVPIRFFNGSGSGITSQVMISGYRTGDASRTLEIGVGTDADDTASFNGLSNYRFDGDIRLPGDNYKLWVGTGYDGYFTYDGTNVVCQPRAVGVGGFCIGIGEAGVDYKFMMHGENSTGTLTWMEDEAIWAFDNGAYFGDGGTTNYVGIGSNGDVSFNGSAGFYPVRISQSAEPTPDTGEMVIWHDSDDDAIRFVYNDITAGVVSVEMT